MLLSRCPVSLWIVFPVIGLGAGLGSWLTFSLGFDHETSPAWQFPPYLVMLACAPVVSMLLGAQPVFSWMGRLRGLLPLLPVVALAVFATSGWVEGGLYSSVRDDRLFPVVMMSALLSASVVGFLALSRSVWMLCGFVSAVTGLDFGFKAPQVPRALRRRQGSSRTCDCSMSEEHEEESQEQ